MPRPLLLLVPLCLFASPSGDITATTCTGTASRSGFAMTYNPDRRQVVIFGGEAPGDILGADTWGWDGSAWHCIVAGGTDGPRPRGAAVLGYDERRQVLVLYGGRVGREELRDTWELNRAGWSRKDSAGPTAEPHGVMAWDEAAGAVLLHHALGDDGPTRATWRWDGRTWSKVAEGPNEEFPDAMLSSHGGEPAMLVTAKPSTVPDAFTSPLYRWQTTRWLPIAVSGAVPTFSPRRRRRAPRPARCSLRVSNPTAR